MAEGEMNIGVKLVERGINNTQKAQVLLDILSTVQNIDAEIDKVCKKREYKAHHNKITAFKKEMKTLMEGDKEVKNALGVSFKTLAILQKAKDAKVKVDKRKTVQMGKMIQALK